MQQNSKFTVRNAVSAVRRFRASVIMALFALLMVPAVKADIAADVTSAITDNVAMVIAGLGIAFGAVVAFAVFGWGRKIVGK